MKIQMTSDQVCDNFAERGVKLTVRPLDENEDFILIEGEAEALRFLAELLLAQAEVDRDCSRHLGPHTAGNIFFSPESTKGIYLHRLPCVQKGAHPTT